MVIDHIILGATIVVASGLMLDHLQPIPYAENLPLYHNLLPLVIKLLCMNYVSSLNLIYTQELNLHQTTAWFDTILTLFTLSLKWSI